MSAETNKARKFESVIISAVYVRETKDSLLLECEGGLEWFTKSQVKFNAEANELDCPVWLLKKKWPNENW